MIGSFKNGKFINLIFLDPDFYCGLVFLISNEKEAKVMFACLLLSNIRYESG
jgi:hypothetical protein